MSSYIAEMTIGSNTYKVLDADISYYQHTRGGGMPSSEIQGGTFTVKIETSDGPQFNTLAEWMFAKSSMQKGVLRFYKKDGTSKLFDFEFYDAHCIRYHEHFHYSDNQPMVTTLTISPGITKMREQVKERPWKVSDIEFHDYPHSSYKSPRHKDSETHTSAKEKDKSSTNVGTPSTVSNGPFSNPDDAARAALNNANPKSIKDNLEYGGQIYQTKDGKYYYSGPVKGSDQGFNPQDAPAPEGTKVVGDYHTHGDYSTVDPLTGVAVRTNDPTLDQFNSDDFSRSDIRGITNDSTSTLGYKGYLGTPSGTYRKYDPAATDKNTVL